MPAIGAIGYALFFALGIFQMVAIAAGFEHWTGLPGFIIWIISFFFGQLPFVGSVLGLAGAIDVWHWKWWWAATLFFGLPAAVIIGSLVFAGAEALTRRRA